MKKILNFAFILSLTSCSVYSSTKLPEINYKKWVEAEAFEKHKIDQEWWNNFSDENLNKIIDIANNNSPDLKIAIARINQARANESEVFAANLPTIEANTSAGRTKSSSNLTNRPVVNKYSNNFKAEFDASWELNIFGVEPAARGASEYREKTLADYNNAKVSLYGEVADTYFNVRKNQMQLSLLYEKQDALNEKQQLQQSLLASGKIDGIQLSQTEVELSTAQALLEQASNDLKQEKYKLELLVGVKPGELDSVINNSFSYQIPSDEIVASAPAEVLANRPDIQSAIHDVAYNDALKDVAVTNLFPRISISGLLGFESGRAGNLFDGKSAVWNATGGLLTPIIDYKKIHSDILQADAGVQLAVANYEKSVLTALSDVERAFASYNSASRNLETARGQFDSAQIKENLIQDRYNNGFDSYINLINAKVELANNQISLEDFKYQVLSQIIRVYKSLGGGWR